MPSYDFEDVAARCDWTPETQVLVLLDFVDSRGARSSLELFLKEKEEFEHLWDDDDVEHEA